MAFSQEHPASAGRPRRNSMMDLFGGETRRIQTDLAAGIIGSRNEMQRFSKPVFLVGPTAVGKSEVALLLASELNAEIVAADSMQVYCGMDIGTAKPTAAERARIPHHLID